MKEAKQPAAVVNEKIGGVAVSVVGNSYRIVRSGKDTGGAYAVIDMLVPPGGGPGPHAHAGFEETFHVLEGEIEFKTEHGATTAKTGDFVAIPRGGLVHCFKNNTASVARLWCVVVPAGLDAFFEEIGVPSVFGQFTPAPELTKEAVVKLVETGKKYGQEVYPPDYLDRK